MIKIRRIGNNGHLPSAKQRFGLEHLLHKYLQMREEHYQAFRRHWYQLEMRDFRRENLDALND